MTSPASAHLNIATRFFSPSIRLQPYIQCYWLSMHNPTISYPILPDGCVDLVFDLQADNANGVLYGTTTTLQEIDIHPYTYYLGIRFQAGQSRHFINSTTLTLTNHAEIASDLLRQDIRPIIEQITTNCHVTHITKLLDQHFELCLTRQAPVQHSIDQAIRQVQHSAGRQRINALSQLQRLSSRQFERLFKEHVGITAKQYAAICRFQYATNLVMQGNSLVNTALDAGFSDQSHFNHDIKKLTGLSPQQFFQQHVVFLQDQRQAKA